MVDVGMTTVVAVLAPELHEYVVTAVPVAVSVTDEPEHTTVLDAEALTIGNGVTVMLSVLVLVHPVVLPTTVYVVDTVGVTVMLPDVCAPGFQV